MHYDNLNSAINFILVNPRECEEQFIDDGGNEICDALDCETVSWDEVDGAISYREWSEELAEARVWE